MNAREYRNLRGEEEKNYETVRLELNNLHMKKRGGIMKLDFED